MNEITMNPNKCQAQKSKKVQTQCPNKKLTGSHFCGLHKTAKPMVITIPTPIIKSQSPPPPTYDITKVIHAQSYCRRFLSRRRFLTVNHEDFYTMDFKFDIPSNYYFCLKHNIGVSFSFDIRSLERLIATSHINPYTSTPISQTNLAKIKYHIVDLRSRGLWKNIEESVLTVDQELRLKMVHVFHEFDMLDNYTDYTWFEELSLGQLKQLYRFCKELWNYKAQLSRQQKMLIVRNGEAFTMSINIVGNMKDIKKLQNIILDEFNRFATEGANLQEKKLGVILMLTALVNVSQRASIGLPQFVQ
jgi:hypothetical protein